LHALTELALALQSHADLQQRIRLLARRLRDICADDIRLEVQLWVDPIHV
jgi:hypothetical protein